MTNSTGLYSVAIQDTNTLAYANVCMNLGEKEAIEKAENMNNSNVLENRKYITLHQNFTCKVIGCADKIN